MVRKLLAFSLAFLLAPAVLFAQQTNQPTGVPSWVVPMERPQMLQPVIMADSDGEVVSINSQGELGVQAQFSGSVEGTSLLTDPDGDTAQIDDNRNLRVILHSNEGDTIGTSKNTIHTYEQFPQRSLFNETTGDTLIINSSGEALITGDVQTEDSDGDRENYEISPTNGYTSVSIAPGSSQTVSFSATANRVSFNATGGTEYRYELNSSSSDTSSMPVYKGQYISKGNGSYDQITFYNPSTNTENIDVTVEPES